MAEKKKATNLIVMLHLHYLQKYHKDKAEQFESMLSATVIDYATAFLDNEGLCVIVSVVVCLLLFK